MRVAGGPDSATGFSQYNQENILGSDASLLSENYMCLELTTMSGDEIYRNPNPQSNLFCRPRSLSWTKETDAITLEMYNNFFDEINDIKDDPVIVNVDNIRLRITVEAIYSLIDGKAVNAIVGNKNTQACPVCIAGVDSVIGPSYFHSRLNSAEWLIRNSAKKNIPNNPALTNPEVRAEHRRILNNLEDQFKAHVNRPKPGGSGSSNNGNLARLMLSVPTAFFNILGMKVKLVENFRLISNLALSSRRLDPEKVLQLYEELEKNIMAEFTFVKKLPPCLHKYKHLPEYITKLPYTINFIDEQAWERMHKRHKFSRSNLARKTSPEDNLYDVMVTALAWSDVKMSYIAQRKEMAANTDDESTDRADVEMSSEESACSDGE
ncbi:uncharacterized protein LOC115254807 [Aedes albopictus]|uniref:Uncharacterized protein n=1 Tax=Aedes albopictus TaxID=7160 RepID=A0ABM1YMB6_AEDAL